MFNNKHITLRYSLLSIHSSKYNVWSFMYALMAKVYESIIFFKLNPKRIISIKLRTEKNIRCQIGIDLNTCRAQGD